MRPYLMRRWLRLAILLPLFIFIYFIFAAGGASAARQGPPSTPPGIAKGEEAIEALGSRLPEVAAAYGMTSRQLHSHFLKDPTLHVDGGGELFYVDEAFPHDTVASQAAQVSPASAPFPEENTFTLQSLPGANHTIYLDFTGHTTVGTTWNSAYGVSTIVSPPYDIDGEPSTFNATEIDRIQTTWQMVSEDFRPFNVNVTTQEPDVEALKDSGGSDTQWGTRVVITDDTFANCGCGGHAYIGSFDDSQDEPVFVYNSSLMGVAEASSHEVGHAINLSHDGLDQGNKAYYTGHGSGETSWAPIMGASYYVNVSHWSAGEYYDANNDTSSANYGRGPDDLAVIASLTNGNGFGYRADDHGDSNGSASALSSAGGVVNDAGIIQTTSDVDVFTFSTGAGTVTFDITPFSPGPNLHVLAQLYDSGGWLVATSNSPSQLAASLSTAVSGGTYYLHIDGTGTGNPMSSSPTGYTEYGSLGQYAISGTIVDTSGNNPPAFSSDPIVEAGATEYAAYSGSIADDASDPDGDGLTFQKISGPAWLSVVSNGALSGTPLNGDVGQNNWTVQVSDGQGGTDQATLQITVANTNDAPSFGSDPIVMANATEDAAYTGTLAGEASDPDGDNVTYSKISGPTWLSVAGDGALSGTPANGDIGLNSWMVQASDGNGGIDQATLQITVDELVPYVDQTATGEIFVAGTVTGSYADTQANGGAAESIRERESGGKKSNRTSYMDHKWVFNVLGGTSVTLYANAWAAASPDDNFVLSYSTDDNTYTQLGQITATMDDDSYQTFVLLPSLSGTIYIRLEDTDRTAGNRTLDTVYVDHMYIRSDTVMPDPPGAPSGLTATVAGPSQIDLAWSDGSDNEQGFRIERSPDGSSGWAQIDEVGADVTSYSDTGLAPNTTYFYRVAAYNAADTSAYSNVASDITGSGGTMFVAAMDGSSTSANRGRWNAMVTITVHDQSGSVIANTTVNGNWGGGANGGDSCITNASGQCAVSKSNIKNNVASVTFTVSDLQHAVNSYDAANNVITVVPVSSP